MFKFLWQRSEILLLNASPVKTDLRGPTLHSYKIVPSRSLGRRFSLDSIQSENESWKLRKPPTDGDHWPNHWHKKNSTTPEDVTEKSAQIIGPSGKSPKKVCPSTKERGCFPLKTQKPCATIHGDNKCFPVKSERACSPLSKSNCFPPVQYKPVAPAIERGKCFPNPTQRECVPMAADPPKYLPECPQPKQIPKHPRVAALQESPTACTLPECPPKCPMPSCPQACELPPPPEQCVLPAFPAACTLRKSPEKCLITSCPEKRFLPPCPIPCPPAQMPTQCPMKPNPSLPVLPKIPLISVTCEMEVERLPNCPKPTSKFTCPTLLKKIKEECSVCIKEYRQVQSQCIH